MTSYGRVLLSHFPCEQDFPGFVLPDGSPRPSLVGMILEGFVSLSVAEIVASETAKDTLEEQVPRQLRRWVTFIDRTDSDSKHAAFFAPIADELGVTLTPHHEVQGASPAVPPEVLSALSTLYLVSNDFFVALDHRVQIQLPARSLVHLLSRLRASLRSPENRARLAAFEGVLRLYGDEAAPSLLPRDLHASAVVGAFSELLRDDLYRALSCHAYGLGVPARAKAALLDMKRTARNILTNSVIRHLFDLGSKGIAVATQLPLPDSRQAADLLGADPYLPPLVDIYSVVDRAYDDFRALSARGHGGAVQQGDAASGTPLLPRSVQEPRS